MPSVHTAFLNLGLGDGADPSPVSALRRRGKSVSLPRSQRAGWMRAEKPGGRGPRRRADLLPSIGPAWPRLSVSFINRDNQNSTLHAAAPTGHTARSPGPGPRAPACVVLAEL